MEGDGPGQEYRFPEPDLDFVKWVLADQVPIFKIVEERL